MEPDYIPFIPEDGLIKLRQIEPFSLGNVNIQLFVTALIELLGNDFYEYWRLKGSTGVKTPGFGVLYNWFAATSVKGIAPVGYRLPTCAEVLSLIYDNGFSSLCNELKDTGVIFWDDPNTGTNVSGFMARGTGYRDLSNDGFFGLRKEVIIWTSSDGGIEAPDQATMFLLPKASEPYVSLNPKVDGASIRLIRDTTEGWIQGEKILDFDGNSYQTVKVGGQVWTTSNLITEHFNDGTKIPLVEDHAKWFALDTEGMCFYENESANGYNQAAPQEIRVHKHDLINFKDTDSLKWRIVELSDTQIQIVADGLGAKNNVSDSQIQSDWIQLDELLPDFIKNKPTFPEAQVQSDWNEVDIEALDYIKNKPEIPDSQVQSNWNETDTEALDFIQNKPDIPEAQIQSDWLQTDSEAVDYIKNKPDSLGSGGDGVSSFTYIAYASDDAGTDFSNVFNPAFDYIAIKTTTSPLVSPVAGDFTGLWKNYKGPIGEPGDNGLPGGPGSDGIPGAAGADDHSMDVYIDFLSVTPFVYNCPYNLKFTSQISEGTGATLSVDLNTNMTQFQKLTITPAQIGLIILKGELL